MPILTDDGTKLRLERFTDRTEKLYSFLNSEPVSVREIVVKHPELGSLDSIQKQVAHLERLGVVKVRRSSNEWKTKVRRCT